MQNLPQRTRQHLDHSFDVPCFRVENSVSVAGACSYRLDGLQMIQQPQCAICQLKWVVDRNSLPRSLSDTVSRRHLPVHLWLRWKTQCKHRVLPIITRLKIGERVKTASRLLMGILPLAYTAS